jgi:hypothetical protein
VSMNYKVSYVVRGEKHPGAILSTKKRPQPGELIQLGEREFVIEEVINLIPSRGAFHYLHVTVRPAGS